MTTQHLSADLARPTTSESIARRAVRAAYLGYCVDLFEICLPMAVLAPALESSFPPL
jgi:hypothetical protein